MPERNIDFGKFSARGIKGSEAVIRQLDDLAGGIVTPVTVKRGLMARLHYLTKTGHSLAAAKDAGLTVTDRTLQAWLNGWAPGRNRVTTSNLPTTRRPFPMLPLRTAQRCNRRRRMLDDRSVGVAPKFATRLQPEEC